MKFKTLITVMLLGTCSLATVAAADPPYNRDDAAYRHRRPEPRFNRYDRARWDSGQGWIPPQAYPGYGYGDEDAWMPLYGKQVGTRFQHELFLTGTPNGLRAVRLDAMRPLYVEKILVEYVDGNKQLVQVNRWLGGRADSTFVIDLYGGRRNVNRVIVYTPQGAGNRSFELSAI